MFDCQALDVLDTGVKRSRTRSYTRDMARIRFRPPGLKPTTKVGTLGPYRGRLGVAWVIAPIVAGVVIILAGYLALR